VNASSRRYSDYAEYYIIIRAKPRWSRNVEILMAYSSGADFYSEPNLSLSLSLSLSLILNVKFPRKTRSKANKNRPDRLSSMPGRNRDRALTHRRDTANYLFNDAVRHRENVPQAVMQSRGETPMPDESRTTGDPLKQCRQRN